MKSEEKHLRDQSKEINPLCPLFLRKKELRRKVSAQVAAPKILISYFLKFQSSEILYWFNFFSSQKYSSDFKIFWNLLFQCSMSLILHLGDIFSYALEVHTQFSFFFYWFMGEP